MDSKELFVRGQQAIIARPTADDLEQADLAVQMRSSAH